MKHGGIRDWLSSRVMQRIALGAPVLGIVRGTPGDGLGAPAEVIDRIALRLAELYESFPGELEDEELRGILVRLHAGSGALAVRVGGGLRLLGEIAGVRQADLEVLRRKTQLAYTLWQLAARLKNNAMDARLLTGAFGWYLIDRVITCLEEVCAGPLTVAQHDALIIAFAPALLEYDQVLRRSHARRQELAKRRAAAAEKAREAQEAAEDAMVELWIRHRIGQPSWEQLVAAAKRHMEKQRAQPGPSLPTDLPLTRGRPRRIIE